MHVKVKQETDHLIIGQLPYFKEILSTNISQKTLDEFFRQFKQNCNVETERPISKLIFLTFWFQLIKKLSEELKELNKIDEKKRFEDFKAKVDHICFTLQDEYNKTNNISKI